MKLKFTYLTLAVALFAGMAMAQSTKTEGKTSLNPLENLIKANSEAKAVEGALEAANGYEAGTTLDIPFVLDLTNEDGEYADSISITFPTGFTINDVSNNEVFFADDEDLDEDFNGIDGQTISWGDNDNDFGGVPAPGVYNFSVNVTVDGTVSGDQTGDFFISGDAFGAAPADLSGNFTITEGVTPTVFSIVANSDVHTTLETALIASGFDVPLSNLDGDFTLFAPTDDAFAAIQSVVDELLLDPTGALANVLLYHVVGGTALSTDLSDGQEILTAQGETVTVAIDGSTITINGAEVTIADLEAGNGVVHVIDAVLVPESCTEVANPFLQETFNVQFGGAPAAEDGVCPLFVNEAFEVYAGEVYSFDNCVEGTTYTFGLIGGAVGAWTPTFVVREGAENLGPVIDSEVNGFTVTWTAPADGVNNVIVQEEGFCGNQSDNTGVDNGFQFITCAGSVSITDIVVNSPDHTTLETAVIAAGLDGTLAGEGPFTVFAPTDDAFAALPAGLLDDLLADPSGALTTVLTHHVVNEVAYSASLSDGQSIPTLLGEDVTVGIDGEVVTITSSTGVSAEVIVADIVASNGVVHVIDAVLVPTVVNVDNLEAVNELRVFPNPTNNQFTLDIELNTSENVSVDLINVVGQVVKSVDLGTRSVGLNREYIDVNDLENGIYFMNLTVGENQGTVKVQIAR